MEVRTTTLYQGISVRQPIPVSGVNLQPHGCDFEAVTELNHLFIDQLCGTWVVYTGLRQRYKEAGITEEIARAPESGKHSGHQVAISYLRGSLEESPSIEFVAILVIILGH